MTVQDLDADLVRLMKNIRIHLPGVLDGVIQLEFFNTLHEFFLETTCWQEDVEFDTEVDLTEYEVYEGEPSASTFALIWLKNADGTDVAADMPVINNIVLRAAPSEVQTLTATLALTCVDPTDEYEYPRYPDWLLKRHYQTIMSGILSKAMAHPAKPYMNERMAVFHVRRFKAGIAQARAAALHLNNVGGQRWRFPKFAGGNQR
jgi:hypothetical protein